MTVASSGVPSDAAIRRATARVDVDGAELDLHYRVTGNGPPLFLLHPSPLDSGFLSPLMTRLADRVTVIAPDTPGFGDSDPLPGPVHDLAPCVRAMSALRDALGLDRVAVYGSATGAQIAVEWAKAEPRAVCGVMLDNAAAFDDADRERITAGYLPDVTASADGSHLARAWHAAHDATLFFPWQYPAAENRISPALGAPEAMHVTARGYLRAGPRYEAVYRAAFRNERVENLRPIAIPLVMLRWQGSILTRWTGRLDACDWGPNVTMAHCGPSSEERWASLDKHLGHILPERFVDAAELCLDTGRTRHVDASFGQICYRPGRKEPVTRLVIPPLGASTTTVEPILASGDALLDLPGHAGSALPDALGLVHCVEAVRRVTDALGAHHLEVAGVGASDGVARTAAVADPRLVHVSLDLPGYSGPPPDLAPETSGAHLFRGWHWLREQSLERDQVPPEPARLTRMLLDLIDAREAHTILAGVLRTGAGPMFRS
ncbi:MAG: alpha/beta hydrolase [Gammaproteobacteria bacterium]|nr:alpha/beta hydrolase [Acidobacteriota bacterium]MYC53482.1 alpha/beta hydrolase [Gammaproteobacteria bacterium]